MQQVVLSLGDDISTDIIYPGRFMATVLPGETPRFAFADEEPFRERIARGEVAPGDVVVAGRNFGCGSSREQAASCLKGLGVTVVARHFARIFLQNAINLGLQLIICPGIEAYEGDRLEFEAGEILNTSSGRRFAVSPLPQARQLIIDAGGLIPYTRQRLMKEMRGEAR